ncbi:glycosyltransferase family 4 protein [Poseidonocella sp. HB161398]|uniref:glycosyltransferase family 4 protein n=1 Tax=Poseidonocella sp. HB161398 TaxID=2320855 RepID=UPI00110866BB|nr:glycosyltransferase family 4 protein [Poseidonocella sp. HB161398]
MSGQLDAIVVADARFAGGSTSALVSDVTAMARLGLRIGLVFVRSAYLDDARDRPNPAALGLRDLDGVVPLAPGSPARARFAFLHHPMVFFRGIEERLRLCAEKSVVVTHHAPFRSDGSLEWDPVATLWRIRRATGLLPWYAPIAPGVRAQLASFAPLITQTSGDWPNIFDPADWPETRPAFSGPVLTAGRHGRADPLKFPATGAEIDAALPAGPDLRIRVLGCPAEALAAKGAHPGRWDVLPFGSEPVPTFLNSLDIFAYHYHPNWLEAFGRTVVEAILCGRSCLLDPRLRPSFGDVAHFCTPSETAAAIARLASDPAASRARALAARDLALSRYSAASVAARLAALEADRGDLGRTNSAAPPHRTLRKLAGLYRRRAAGSTG